MTLVELVDKSTQQVVERMSFYKDETLEELLYWVEIALAADPKTYAQFIYDGSSYLVEVDK